MIEIYYTKIDTADMTRGQIRSTEHRIGNKMLAFVLKSFHGMKVLPEIETADSGKPYLSDGSFCYNISHRHGRIVLALSDKPIGVDIERNERAIPDLVKRKLFPDGNATVSDWTKFESYSKLTGECIYSTTYPPVNEDVYFKSYVTEDKYVISVCAKENGFPEEIFVFDN